MRFLSGVFLPIACATVAAFASGYVWETVITDLNAYMASISGVLIGAIVFCTLVLMISFLRMDQVSNRLKKLEDGILSYENRFAKKLDELEAVIPSSSRMERIERKLAHRKESVAKHSDLHNINAREASRNEEVHALAGGKEPATKTDKESGNVVPLHPVSDDIAPLPGDMVPVEGSSPNFFKKKAFSTDGVHIRLQPSVSLETREIFAFESSVCVANRFGELHDDATVRSMLETSKDYRAFDKHVAGQAMSLVRALRRQGKSPLVFVGISAATLKSASTFERFLDTIKAQQKLNRNIAWEIRLEDYVAFSSSQRARLRQILEYGYSMCLGECTDQDAAADIMAEGTFEYAKMPVSELEHIDTSELLNPEPELMIACGKADAQLIVTGVQSERQAIYLIDQDIQYAQGDFFSPPKFPNINQTGTKNGTKNQL